MIALLGGTFNPIHNGHIEVALEVLRAYPQCRVELVPSFQTVHRDQPQVDAETRARMIGLAVESYSQLALNRIELELGGSSYSVDTLEALHEQYPEKSLCWIMGSDAFLHFHCWRSPDRIFQLANLIVVQRPGTQPAASTFSERFLEPDQDLQDYAHGRIEFIDMIPNHCSSTAVREAIRFGHAVDDCLAAPVIEFIQQNHLYEF